MDNYFTNEISELKLKMNALTNKNKELRKKNQSAQNDLTTKKQKVVDSWAKLFREFKKCFNSINDVQNLITKFSIANNIFIKTKEFQDEKESKKSREEAKKNK